MSETRDVRPRDGERPPSTGTSLGLLARARANDAAAWGRLVALYAPLVFHWCRRWGLQEEDAADPGAKPMFCLPAKGVERTQAISEFVQWASADPSRMAMPAADGVAGFLTARYPCSR